MEVLCSTLNCMMFFPMELLAFNPKFLALLTRNDTNEGYLCL